MEYTVVVGAGSTVQAALFSLQEAVKESFNDGYVVTGGATLTIAPPHTVAGFELRDTFIFIYSQGMVKHETHS